jgi:hypothetical protein
VTDISLTFSNKKVNHLLILNLSFLMQKCRKNVSHLLILSGHFYRINVAKTSVTFLLHLCIKNDHSILTGDSCFCYIFALKRTNSILTGDWLFCYIFTVKRNNSILTSHLFILNGHFYFINVTKTSVTC